MRVDIERILFEIESLPKFKEQIMLQSVKPGDDPFYGTGRVTEISHKEYEFVHPTFDHIPYLNSIIEKLGLKRTRLMNLSPRTCYTYHMDYTPRVHIPLITNERCFLVLDDEVQYMPADGTVYLVDTRLKHTAINASKEDRIHLVGIVPADYVLPE